MGWTRLRAQASRPSAEELARQYSERLRRGVSVTMGDAAPTEPLFEVRQRALTNVTRFGVYKGYNVSAAIDRAADGLPEGLTPAERARLLGRRIQTVCDVAATRQDAEYNTTVRRCRTAKQFAEFNAPERRRLFPNLEWLPSRSAEPREEHRHFYHRIWRKDDPFWQTNYPGNLWNCKCDLEETDDAVTEENWKLPTVRPAHGLGENPQSGEIFSQQAAYFKTSAEVKKKANAAYLKGERVRMAEEHEGTAELVAMPNLATGHFNNTKRAFKNLLHHCYNELELATAAVLPFRIGKLSKPVYSPLGEGKNLKDDKDIKNVAGKQERGVIGYNKYLFECLGKTCRIVMEVHKNGFEQLYAITPEKR